MGELFQGNYGFQSQNQSYDPCAPPPPLPPRCSLQEFTPGQPVSIFENLEESTVNVTKRLTLLRTVGIIKHV
jgi:hypothetical protein